MAGFSNTPTDGESQLKDTAQCRPYRNECSKAGTGLDCSNDRDSQLAASAKDACLSVVKRQCEDRYKDCLNDCDKQFEKDLLTADPDRDAIAANNSKPATDPTRKPGFVYDQGYGSNSLGAGWGGIKGVNPDGPRMTKLSDFGMAINTYNLGGGDPYVYFMEAQYNQASCYGLCAYNNIRGCETAHCYCNLLNCKPPASGANGIGGGVPDPGKPDGGDGPNTTPSGSIDFDTHSEFDIPIELVYTRAYMPGNIIWVANLITSTNQSVYSSTDDVTQAITMAVTTSQITTFDLIIGLCAGEIEDVNSIRLSGSILYDKTGLPLAQELAEKFVVLKGTASQKVLQEAAETQGFGRTPAYRDIACVYLKNFAFNAYGKFPNWSIEVIKKINPDEAIKTSEPIVGKDTSKIWAVHPESKRLFVGSSDGVVALDYDTMEEIWTEPAINPIEITPMGKILTYDGVDIAVYDPGMSASYGSFPATRTISSSFGFRAVDLAGNAGYALLSQDDVGQSILEEIDDIIPLFPNDVVAIRDLQGMDTAPSTIGLMLDYIDETTIQLGQPKRSYVLFRRLKSVADTIRITEMRMLSSASDILLEDEKWLTYDLPTTLYGGSQDITLTGGIACRGGSAIIFVTDGTTSWATKWSSSQGLIWNAEIPHAPFLGKYSGARATDFTQFTFVATGNTVHSLDITTGAITVVPNTGSWPAIAGLQFYDASYDVVVYESAGGTITTASPTVKVLEKETLADAALDIARRSGLSTAVLNVADVTDIGITGYRSGDSLVGADMLTTLMQLYQAYVNDSYQLIFRHKSYNNLQDVDPTDSSDIPSRKRKVIDPQEEVVTVNYLSVPLFGDPATQSFTTNQTVDRLNVGSAQSYSYTALETDTYMYRLAEFLAYTNLAPERDEDFSLPPRYLALEAGDAIDLGYGARAYKVTVGANNSVSISSYADDPSRYDDFIALSSPGVVQSAVTSLPAPSRLEAPIGFSMRMIDPAVAASAGVYLGVSNIEGAFEAPTSVGRAPTETPNIVGGDVKAASKPMIWGRLTVAPDDLPYYTPQFKTFKNASFAIQFPERSFVDRVLNKNSLYGFYPDRRTVDSYYNTIAVGKELIQYGFAEEHPSIDRTIVFHDLLRCRQNTDRNSVGHTPGEFCAVVEPDCIESIEVQAAAMGVSYKMMSYGTTGDKRRGDIQVDEDALLPVAPNGCLRMDVPNRILTAQEIASGILQSSSKFPGNPDVILVLRLRDNFGTGLTNSSVDRTSAMPLERVFNVPTFFQGAPGSNVFNAPDEDADGNVIDVRSVQRRIRRECKLYFLRAAYDEQRFNDNLDKGYSDLSYIMMQTSFGSYENRVPGIATEDGAWYFVSTNGSALYSDKSHTTFYLDSDFFDIMNWDNLKEPLVVVMVTKNDYGESERIVYSFPPDPNIYLRQPVMGTRFLPT